MAKPHPLESVVGATLAPPEALAAWRKQTRTELLERRLGAGSHERARWSTAIVQHLSQVLPEPDGRVLGFCWPYKAEPDVLPTVRRWIEKGGMAALPVVVQTRAPMVFRRWHPDALMTKGVYDIAIPADTEELQPGILLIPLTGFDAAGYRLGYGGGFFDRTVVALQPRPLMIGVGFDLSRLPTIFPQPHDQPMDIIVTESGVRRPTQHTEPRGGRTCR